MPEEYTTVVSGVEDVIHHVLKKIANTRKWLCICGDSNLPAAHLLAQSIVDAMMDASKKRGVVIRMITEVTKDNIRYCRQNMDFAELRHLNGIRGNFGVSDFEYQATAEIPEKGTVPRLIISNSKAILDQQKYLFEMLWSNAVPFNERAREIEYGIEAEFLRTIQDPDEIQKLGYKLVASARQEILILFSTANAFRRQEAAGLIDLLVKKAKENDAIGIKILTPVDKGIIQAYIIGGRDGATGRRAFALNERLVIKRLEPQSQTRVSLLIVDRKYSLSAELKDDAKETSRQAIGFGSFSNSKSTVFSYVSIFETLWTQSDLYQNLRDANSRLQQAIDILQDHDRLQREFINIAAHELRTPIQPILGLSQTLRESSPYPEQQEFLDAILRNAKRLHALAEEILQVSRIESNLLKINPEEFDLDEIVRGVVHDIKSEGKDNLCNNSIKFSIRTEKKKIRIKADRDKLRQVIRNLVENAVKFTPGGRITVSANKSPTSNDVIVSVKDSGTGIDREIMPRLFTKFASKSNGGTGLGLFICKSIIEAHGGEIWGENNAVRKGATFWFRIPAEPDAC